MFSLLLTTVFTVIEPDVESPTVDILCQVDEDNIILSHVGGESLSTQIKIILNIGTESNQEYLVDDYLKDELKGDGWGFGESLILTSNQIVVNDINVNLFDEESNWSLPHAITIVVNRAPNVPLKPSGSARGKIETEYSYTSSTTDPDGDQIQYGWDWNGDGQLQSSVTHDINSDDESQTTNCGGIYTVLTDHDDWGNIYMHGLSDDDGSMPVTKEIITCGQAPQ